VLRRVLGQGSRRSDRAAEKALAGLSGEFKNWMSVEADRLAAAHATILRDGFTDFTRQELFRAAHDIKGDAATFGFPSAGAAAESLCRIIEHAPDLDEVPSDLIAHHINAIQAIVRGAHQLDTVSTASELGRQLRAFADEYLTHAIATARAPRSHPRPEPRAGGLRDRDRSFVVPAKAEPITLAVGFATSRPKITTVFQIIGDTAYGSRPGRTDAESGAFVFNGIASCARHCERSEAIHRAAQRKNGLLRFARNDEDSNARLRPRRRNAPEALR